jgi:lysophospholipase L1-like esterase
MSDPLHPRCSWPGSAIAARFSGNQIHVRLADTGYDELEVVLDGMPRGVISTNPKRQDYEVAAGLAPGPHDVVLSKRTEARMGELTFLGLSPAEALADPPPAATRRIELIGDSITAGYGDLGVGASCTGNVVALENEFLSYGAIAARTLDAEHVTIAWAGKTIEQMADLYDRTIASRPDSRWDFATWTPDAVVINLGTNDFNHGDPGATAFTKAYVVLVRRVRLAYPHALIVSALGPMLTDTYPPGARALSRARAYLTEAMAQLRANGETHLSFIEFPAQDVANGIGCDYHPSVKTHRLMGASLASMLKTELEW